MSLSSAYLFFELAVFVFLLGFGWEHWNLRDLASRLFWIPAVCLASLWFLMDQIAVRLSLWMFPEDGSLPIRLFSLPIEEYLFFFLHTLICYIFVKHYSMETDE